MAKLNPALWTIFDNESAVYDVINGFESLNQDRVPFETITHVVKLYMRLSPADKSAIIELSLDEAYQTKCYRSIQHFLSVKQDPIIESSIRQSFKKRGRYYQNFERLGETPSSWTDDQTYRLKRIILNILSMKEHTHLLHSGPVLFPVLHKTLSICSKYKSTRVPWILRRIERPNDDT